MRQKTGPQGTGRATCPRDPPAHAQAPKHGREDPDRSGGYVRSITCRCQWSAEGLTLSCSGATSVMSAQWPRCFEKYTNEISRVWM